MEVSTAVNTAIAEATPEHGHQGDARDRQRQEGDDDRAAREHDGAAGRGHRPGDRLADLHAVLELLLVLGHQEQGVVDADPEADHRRERRSDGRHREQMTHQADHRGGDRQTDRGAHDRQPHRHEAAEDEGEDHHRRDVADQLTGLRLGRREHAADRAADRDLDPRFACGRGRIQDLLGELGRDETGPDVE